MTRSRLVLSSALTLVLMLGLWLWWVRPTSIDMASYAPAESLIYIEANSASAIADALGNSRAWKIVDGNADGRPRSSNSWFGQFVRWTGLGPINSVILARSQMAVVVTNLGVAEEGETLTIKPEGALIIETHTSAGRIKQPTEQVLRKFAEMIYDGATFKQTTIDGREFLEWRAPEGSRQVVATIVGSVVIVGNAERPVKNVLAVILKRQPSLVNDDELREVRRKLDAKDALTLGYVPSKSSPHLLSVMVPIVLGRAPDNAELGRLIEASAAKIIGSIGWSCRSFNQGIEDRYLIGVQPDVMPQLSNGFQIDLDASKPSAVIRDGIVSVTNYRFANPAKTWQALKTAVSGHVDAVSAVLFSSLLRAAVLSYGINEPEKFLNLVNSSIVTVRLENSSGALLIATPRDDAAIRNLLTTAMGYRSVATADGFETLTNPETDSFARVGNGSIIMGAREDMDKYVEMLNSPSTTARSVDNASSQACVVSYADDSSRVRAFISSLIAARRTVRPLSNQQQALISSLPYATTETVLGDTNIERTTRSPLGQFSTILPLIFSERPAKSLER